MVLKWDWLNAIQASESYSEEKCSFMSLVPYGSWANNLVRVPPVAPDVIAPLLVEATTPWLWAWA